MPFDDLSDMTILTLATLGNSFLVDVAVSTFNRTSTTHIIQVINYSEYATSGADGWVAALDRLNLDIITAGRIPDMIDMAALMPLRRFAMMGLLEDLYPFIDGDIELSRESFVDGVLNAIEINSGVYSLFPNFGVNTLIGNPYFVGDYPGWDMDEFQTVLRDNPLADRPLGNWLSRETFLNMTFPFFIGQFVNWETASADFDNEIYVSLLETFSFLPVEVEVGWDAAYTDHELIARGRQIMNYHYFFTIDAYLENRALFGGDIVFKGYPSENRMGNQIYTANSIAMTVTCVDKDGAWEFIRSFLTVEGNRRSNNSLGGIPVNKVVFDDMLDAAMTEPEFPRLTDGLTGYQTEVIALTPEEADRIRGRGLMTSSIAFHMSEWDLLNIVREEALKYFRGQTTAQDAARVTQNRASTFHPRRGEKTISSSQR
jgi:ABC-type glycerol-3-phosphate transport system substrate-binding protein